MNSVVLFDRTKITGVLADFNGSVVLLEVDETPMESLWDDVVEEYHYLGCSNVIGRRVKYLITMGEAEVLGAISFCSAAYQLGLRDRFVGWDDATRLEYLPHLINNNRFLILPCVRIRNLASHVLGLSLIQVRQDWLRKYDVEPLMVETFVDPSRFTGTSYKAANWTCLGLTKGFGKVGNGFVFHGQHKALYVKVISRRFEKIFKPDAARLPDPKRDILEVVSDHPVCWPGIMDSAGVAYLADEDFNDMLSEHLVRYQPYLGRKEHLAHMAAFVKGHLGGTGCKNIWNIALDFREPSQVRNMYNFMTRSSFDDEGMLEELRKETIGLLQHPSGMITGDMFDFPKLGNNSVGIASQYCDRLGRFENCQSGVMEGYVGLGGCGITNYSLFMPEKWFGDDHSDLRKQCKVPEDLGFRTKPQMMLEMILETHNSGTFKAKYIGLGREFGGDCAFLDSLPEDLTYFADIPATFCVFLGRTGNIVPEYYGSVRNSVEATSLYPRSVEDIARDCSIPWVDVALGSGAKGPIITREKCIKVIVVRNGNPGKDIWLYVRQLNDSSIKYSLCNECLDATPGAIRIPALMRCSMERCFDEHKNNLGVASYEVRSWPGWRRHILFTLIAHSFVLKLRRKFSTRIDSP